MSRQSLTKAQANKDPLKQITRSNFPMKEEPGNRVHGAVDGATRHNMVRHALVSQTDGTPFDRVHDSAAGELRTISHRTPDLARFDGLRGRYRPLIESSLDVAREPHRVGSPADVSVMAPDSRSFYGPHQASSQMRRRVHA